MATTKTKTVTKTYARTDLLIMQVEIALRRTVDIGETSLKKVFERGLREKIIGEIDIYGVDDQGYCRAQIRIEIDWKRHQLHIQEEREDVTINSRWIEGTSFEIDAATILFNEWVSKRNLRTFCHVIYAPGVDRSEANAMLGLHPADPVKWKGKKCSDSYQVDGLDELCVGLYACVDDD